MLTRRNFFTKLFGGAAAAVGGVFAANHVKPIKWNHWVYEVLYSNESDPIVGWDSASGFTVSRYEFTEEEIRSLFKEIYAVHKDDSGTC